MSFKTKLAAAAIGVLVSAGAMATPTNFSFNGTFAQDDNVQLFNFSVSASSAVTLVSYGYAGGTQANGNVVGRGGFDTILALFNASTGALIDQNDDSADATCGSVSVATDPVTGRRYDTCLNVTLAAGNYTVSVMEFDNFAAGSTLSAGFTRTGQGNFTGGLYNCSNGRFCDTSGTNRSTAWAFDILNVDQAATPSVPEPAGLALVGMALLGLVASRRRRG